MNSRWGLCSASWLRSVPLCRCDKSAQSHLKLRSDVGGGLCDADTANEKAIRRAALITLRRDRGAKSGCLTLRQITRRPRNHWVRASRNWVSVGSANLSCHERPPHAPLAARPSRRCGRPPGCQGAFPFDTLPSSQRGKPSSEPVDLERWRQRLLRIPVSQFRSLLSRPPQVW